MKLDHIRGATRRFGADIEDNEEKSREAPNLLRRFHIWISKAPPNLTEDEQEVYGVLNYAVLLALSFHLNVFALMFYLEVTVLWVFNIFSVLLFSFNMLISRKGYLNTGLVLGSLEVVVHSWVASLALGWTSGFHYHSLILVVLWFLFTGIKIQVRTFQSILFLVLYLFLFLLVQQQPPTYQVSSTLLQVMGAANIVVFLITMIGICYYYTYAVATARADLKLEFKRSEYLLHNILPVPIAERLKKSDGVIADSFPICSVLFSDIVGFTPLSAKLQARELVDLLNDIFSGFDDLAEKHGLEKIKTIGDAYMVASGIPERKADHARAIAYMALDMRDFMSRFRNRRGVDIHIRIGIHSGPVVAGVIGRKKFIYDLWGDTVNIAARMESHGVAGEIQVSNDTRAFIEDHFSFEDRGEQEIKGKGMMKCYLLKGEREAIPDHWSGDGAAA
jgi:adenylate cyclase